MLLKHATELCKTRAQNGFFNLKTEGDLAYSPWDLLLLAPVGGGLDRPLFCAARISDAVQMFPQGGVRWDVIDPVCGSLCSVAGCTGWRLDRPWVTVRRATVLHRVPGMACWCHWFAVDQTNDEQSQPMMTGPHSRFTAQRQTMTSQNTGKAPKTTRVQPH